MTRVQVWFTIKLEADDTVEIDAKPDDIGGGEVYDAIRIKCPFAGFEVDDWEVVESEHAGH